jgi:hypothetical protein
MLDQIHHTPQQSMQCVQSIVDNPKNARRSDELLLLLTIDQDEDHITEEECKQLNAQLRIYQKIPRTNSY